MTTTTPPAVSESAGQELIAYLKSDAINTFGTPVATFLQAEIAAKGDPVKIGAAAIVAQTQLFAAAPTALAGLEAELGQFFLGRILAAQAANQAKPLT